MISGNTISPPQQSMGNNILLPLHSCCNQLVVLLEMRLTLAAVRDPKWHSVSMLVSSIGPSAAIGSGCDKGLGEGHLKKLQG